MSKPQSEDDLLEKSSRTQNKKHRKNKHRVAEGEFRGMQKKTNFKRFLNDIYEDDDLDDLDSEE